MPPDGPCDWGDFPDTVLHFSGSAAAGAPTSISIDLRQDVSEDDLRVVARLGLDPSFGVVTAADPIGTDQSPELNEEMTAKLRRDIMSIGASFVAVDACSPDRSHCERSFAVATHREDVIELACRYHQRAIFWFDGTSFWIVPALSRKSALRLPLDAATGSSIGSGRLQRRSSGSA